MRDLVKDTFLAMVERGHIGIEFEQFGEIKPIYNAVAKKCLARAIGMAHPAEYKELIGNAISDSQEAVNYLLNAHMEVIPYIPALVEFNQIIQSEVESVIISDFLPDLISRDEITAMLLQHPEYDDLKALAYDLQDDYEQWPDKAEYNNANRVVMQ